MWARWSDFAAGDFSTHVITPILVSLVTAIIAGSISRWNEERKRCKNAFLAEVNRHVVLLRELSERAVAEVRVQLVGNPTTSFKNSLQQVGIHTRGVAMNVEMLKIYLPPDVSVSLENASYKWASELTAEPYPVQKKSDALPAHDPHLKSIHTAHVEWQKYLSKFVMECTTGKINLNAD